MKVALSTVVYCQAREYLDELIASVCSQTCDCFDYLIINDNYDCEELKKIVADAVEKFVQSDLKNEEDDWTDKKTLQKTSFESDKTTQAAHPEIIIIDKSAEKLSPADLRVELLLEAKKRGYDLVIVADADDTFKETRVAEYIKAYELDKNATFYYNCLDTVAGQAVFDQLPPHVTKAEQIAQYNFLGLSTTGINLNQLSADYIESLRASDCRIYDWYLFTRLLLDVGYGIYVPNASTYYRIHDGNIAGVSQDLELEKQVKLSHYKRLAVDYPLFAELYEKLSHIELKDYVASTDFNGYWWSRILMRTENIR